MKIVVHKQLWVAYDGQNAYHFDLTKEYREWSLRLPRSDTKLYRGTWEVWIREEPARKLLVFHLKTTKMIRQALELRTQRPEFFVVTSEDKGTLVMDTKKPLPASLLDKRTELQSHIR